LEFCNKCVRGIRMMGIKARRIITALLAALLAVLPPTAYASNRLVTQNWAESAVFYSLPSDETETYHMSGEEFLFHRINLEDRLVYAYSALLHTLEGEQKQALIEAQRAWIDCYYAYIYALEQLWLEPVKIHFGVTGHERKTNVYRETILLLLTNRITDLEEWKEGRLVGIEQAGAVQAEENIKEARRQLRIDMGLCLYVIDEKYRYKITTAQNEFFDFLDANAAFVDMLTENGAQAAGETLLQIQRMSYMTGVHYEGCRFFRREREE